MTSLKCNGIIDSYTDGTYKPANGVTRGAVTKYVSNALEFNEVDVDFHLSNDFPDVPKNHTFYKYISYLATVEYNNETVIKGFSDGTYRPDIVLKRGPMAKIIDLSRNIVGEEPIGPSDPVLDPTTNPNLSIEFTTIPSTALLGSEFEIVWHYEDDESLITSCTSWSKIKNSSSQTKPAFEGQEVLLEIPMTGGQDPLTFEGTRADNEIRPVGTTAELIEIISDNTGDPLTYSGITLGANYYETFVLSSEVESGDVIEFFVSCRDDYTGDVISTTKEITIDDSQAQCVGEGELVTLWDEIKTCCTGLVEIINGVLIGDQCAYPTDGSYYCSDCGNGTCESWENICNCEADCI
ncbi:hypothetical protein GF362_02620 [Candidatus Dojkabacteria bacterium]|nr:hypothetical protein [Candidatus Dojkabacteria bacterium]